MQSYPKSYIQINTKFRTKQIDNTNNCRIEFPNNLTKGIYRLVMFLFPNTICTVNSNNNKISVQEIGNNKIVTCLIENGFYTYETLPYAIVKALNDSIELNKSYSFNYDDLKYKIEIINSSIEFRIIFDNQMSSCSELLGYSLVTTNYAKNHMSQGLINLEPIHMLNLSIDGINSINQQNQHGTTFVIPISSERFGYTNYVSEINFQQHMYVNSDKRSINLKLTDELNRLVDLNRADFMFILEKLDGCD